MHKLALSYSMTAISMWYLPYLTLPYQKESPKPNVKCKPIFQGVKIEAFSCKKLLVEKMGD